MVASTNTNTTNGVQYSTMPTKLTGESLNAMPKKEFDSFLTTAPSSVLNNMVTMGDLSPERTKEIAAELLKRRSASSAPSTAPGGTPTPPSGTIGSDDTDEATESDAEKQIEALLKELKSGKSKTGQKLTAEQIKADKAELATLLKNEVPGPTAPNVTTGTNSTSLTVG